VSLYILPDIDLTRFHPLLQYMKSDGCNKIKCNCGTLSCYLCGETIEDYSHFCNHKKSGPCECGKSCRLWTNTDEMEELDRHKRREAGRKVLMDAGYTDEKIIQDILMSPPKKNVGATPPPNVAIPNAAVAPRRPPPPRPNFDAEERARGGQINNERDDAIRRERVDEIYAQMNRHIDQMDLQYQVRLRLVALQRRNENKNARAAATPDQRLNPAARFQLGQVALQRPNEGFVVNENAAAAGAANPPLNPAPRFRFGQGFQFGRVALQRPNEGFVVNENAAAAGAANPPLNPAPHYQFGRVALQRPNENATAPVLAAVHRTLNDATRILEQLAARRRS
jgi:hypothetical protein